MFCVTDVNPPWPFNNWSKHGLARRCARLLAPPSRRSTGNLLIVSHRRLAGAGKVLISRVTGQLKTSLQLSKAATFENELRRPSFG